jgi:adenine-specific DNA-methyltransferase
MAHIQRLNYIGSKYQLLDWIQSTMHLKVGWTDWRGKRVADLFAGTGIVSYHFRTQGATVLSNDAELYSSVITKAFTCSTYTETCQQSLRQLNEELQTGRRTGYITKHYSPFEGCERMFFTVETAQKIDFVRSRIEDLKATLSEEEYTFLLASLLVSADAVSNVPAVYGCYLKKFKQKALKAFSLIPVHTHPTAPPAGSNTFSLDVLSQDLLNQVEVDVVYLDPPYNERQYSKNYFPLNAIAKPPSVVEADPPLTGKTGIPADCFLSPFCQKKKVADAFDRLIKDLKATWVFLSYNSESLVSKEAMLEILKTYGTVSLVEREYKRFKSFEYNEDKQIKEYLFCLQKSTMNT